MELITYTESKLKGYHKIDELETKYGLLELWEHDKQGDDAAAIVTEDGHFVDYTFDSLYDFYHDFYE